MGNSTSTFAVASTEVSNPQTINWSATLATIAGATFVLASAATNLIYGIAKGHDLPSQLVWGSISVAASVVLALAPSAFLISVQHRRIGAALMALVAAGVFGAYSVTAALGSASGSRMTASANAQEVSQARSRAQKTYDEASAALSLIPEARPTAELGPLITSRLADKRLGDCEGWLESSRLRAVCIEVGSLKAELGRAQRRAELEARMQSASDDLAMLASETTIANTDAVALAGYFAAFGVPVSTDTLNRALVVLAVLVIELGGGLSLAVGMALRSRRPEPVSTGLPFEYPQNWAAAPILQAVDSPAPAASKPSNKALVAPDRKGRKASGEGEAAGRIVETLKANGGRAPGSVRGLAALIGSTKSTTHNALVALASAGIVERLAGEVVLAAAT